MTLQAPPLGLYVHLPWCVRKCPYCDFNSHAQRGAIPHADYTAALLRDAADEASRAGGRPLASIFIGGGTPSLFPPHRIAELLAGLQRHLTLARDCEITLEANPGTVERERFRGFREAGVNRLSIGVQSFHDAHLTRLGRIHSAGEAESAAEAAVAAGYARYNLDLMYALPGQTVAEAVADAERATNLGARHVSHYQLTLEPGTAFHARPPTLPDEDTAADMQSACAEALAATGLERYEVSAWAAPGHACRHNRNYWEFGDYLAIGAGGHAKVTDPASGHIERYSKPRLPRAYMAAAGTAAARVERRTVGPDELPLEFMMNALRLTDGVLRDHLPARTGLDWPSLEAPLTAAAERGLVAIDAERIRPTDRGIEFLNDTLSHFL